MQKEYEEHEKNIRNKKMAQTISANQMRRNEISRLDAQNDLFYFPKRKVKLNQKKKNKKQRRFSDDKLKQMIGNKKPSIW